MADVTIGTAGPPTVVTSEAETALLRGAAVAANWAGFAGTGFVDFMQDIGESVTWTLDVAQTGTYRIGLRHALNDAVRNALGRAFDVLVGGVSVARVECLPSGPSYADWAVTWFELALDAGTVSLGVATTGESGANLDQLLVERVPILLGNAAPQVEGSVPNVVVMAGRASALDTSALTLMDADVADVVTARLTLADGAALPPYLTFDAASMTLRATAAAPAGQYALLLRADDGQARSATAVAFTVDVRAGAGDDLDGDGIANRRDKDDDGDGLKDIADPFFADASNGGQSRIDPGTRLLLDFEQVPAGESAGWGYGLTGLMGNGQTPELLGLDRLRFADGALRIEDAGKDGPGPDRLKFGAMVGVDPNAPVMRASALFDSPFAAQLAAARQNFGLFVGTGTQDDYVRLILVVLGDGTLTLRLEGEEAGAAIPNVTLRTGITAAADAADTIRLGFELDTVLGVVRPFWTIETARGVLSGDGEAFAMGDALLATARGEGTVGGAPSGLAIGVNAGSAPGAPLDLDVLELSVEGVALGDVGLTALGTPLLTDRVVFNWIDDPGQRFIPDREYKDIGAVEVRNTGPGALDIAALRLDGPFRFLDDADATGRTLASGGTLLVEIAFDRALYTPPARGTGGQFSGALTVVSDDADEPLATIGLAGWWQTVPEAGREPELNDILEVFGFGNRVDEALLHNGRYEQASPEEVLAPYWRIAPGFAEVRIVQLAGFKDAGIATLSLHAPGDQEQTRGVLQQSELYNQSFLPVLTDGGEPTRAFDARFVPDAWEGEDWFGFRSAGNSSDPRLNRAPGHDGEIRGHFVRFFQALDADGAAMADTYVIAVDFNGSNLDFNDTVYLVTGIAPVTELIF